MLRLAVEWGVARTVAPRVSLLPGEGRRDGVLTVAEESAYVGAAQTVGEHSWPLIKQHLLVYVQNNVGITDQAGRSAPFPLCRDCLTRLRNPPRGVLPA
jgi:hypothetical protein